MAPRIDEELAYFVMVSKLANFLVGVTREGLDRDFGGAGEEHFLGSFSAGGSFKTFGAGGLVKSSRVIVI
jgi:hypothetical protein